MTLIQKIGTYAGAFLTASGMVVGVWEAAPILAGLQEIYEKRREILHSSDLIDEIHDLQSRYNAIELRLDSAHVEIDVLKQGKLPVDSVWVNSETGWRKFHVKTKWLWRRRD